MKREDVKIGMMVELTCDYASLSVGEVYKVLKLQVEGANCFVVEHDGDESYLAPFCEGFKPYKGLKKHELLKKAYDNYPKGTRFIGFNGDEFISSGNFIFAKDCIDYAYNCDNILNNPIGLVYDADTDKWAEIIEEVKKIEVPLYFMNKTAVVKANYEVHILDGSGHTDAKLSHGDIHYIQKAINKLK